ncbi:MAG: hypothetical protein AAGD14_10195 [Planctomycetota bacterium]
MLRVALVSALLAGSLAAAPSRADLLARWDEAGPGERLALRRALRACRDAQRFVDARCVLIEFDKRTRTLAELYREVLEPALVAVPKPDRGNELGLLDAHRAALAGLDALGAAYRPPAPVDAGTLNLVLDYASDVLNAWQLTPRVRLRLFTATLEVLRSLEDRAEPDAWSRWVLNHEILPALLGLGRRFADDPRLRAIVGRAAEGLTLPSILDDASQARLAALTSGRNAREILRRAYQKGRLDATGVTALARSVAAVAGDDEGFLTGAAPLLLELLADARVPPVVRGELVDLVLERMGALAPLRPIVAELVATAYGAPPRPFDAWKQARAASGGPIAHPPPGETYRFLQVVLLRTRPDRPPSPARVVRRDVRLQEPMRTARGVFLGVLVPSVDAGQADFLGPTPGLRGVPDSRLLRRPLALERIAMRAYGARGEEIEICLALPRDGSEPVPATGARLEHVLALVAQRLERSQERAEIDSLVGLLVRIDTRAARELAARHAPQSRDAAGLLEMMEKGDRSAVEPLLARLGDLEGVDLERALIALLEHGGDPVRTRLRALAKDGAVPLAIASADALLKAGEADGVSLLLAHENRYARLAGAGLTLRLTSLAGGLRIIPRKAVDLASLAKRSGAAFPKSMGLPWRTLGTWLPRALREPEKIPSERTNYDALAGNVMPERFALLWTERVNEGKQRRRWGPLISYVLDPKQPGRGIRPERRDKLLAALEARAMENDALRKLWIESWLLVAVVESGMKFEKSMLPQAQAALRRAAGDTAPAGARRKPGLYWPIWAAKELR